MNTARLSEVPITTGAGCASIYCIHINFCSSTRSRKLAGQSNLVIVDIPRIVHIIISKLTLKNCVHCI